MGAQSVGLVTVVEIACVDVHAYGSQSLLAHTVTLLYITCSLSTRLITVLFGQCNFLEVEMSASVHIPMAITQLHLLFMLQTAWDLTDAQVHDLLYARYLFRCKCGHLINAHVELMRQLEGVSSTQSSSQASIVDLTDQLQVLNNEGYKSYMLYSSLFYRGVCPCLSLTTNQM